MIAQLIFYQRYICDALVCCIFNHVIRYLTMCYVRKMFIMFILEP